MLYFQLLAQEAHLFVGGSVCAYITLFEVILATTNIARIVAHNVACNVPVAHCNIQHYNFAMLQHWNIATMHLCNIATVQLCNSATLQHCNIATLQLCNFATLQLCNIATL